MNRVSVGAALGVAVMVIGAAGCKSSQDPNMPPGSPGVDALPGYPQIVTMDGLGQWLVAEPSIIQHEPGKLLRVTQPIRSITDYQHLRVQYRFIYMDAQGRPMRAPEEWRYIVVPARTQVFMEGNALSTEAVDWRLEIRSAR